jgi:hypothetical protein
MFKGSTTTFMTAVNPFKKFQSAAQEQKELPSGLVEREGVAIGGSPLPSRSLSTAKKPLTSRNRTYTSPSLYSQFEKTLPQETESDTRSRAVSSPDNTSFANSFMRTSTRPQQQHRPWGPPKTPTDPGCILPGPARAINPFEIASVQACTVAGAPAWWCRHDKLVIFDGYRTDKETGIKKWITRTSKGLEASRKRCAKESVQVDLSCEHCRSMLGKKKWVYEVRVCELSVCRTCKARCEKEQAKKDKKREDELKSRRDSFLASGPPVLDIIPPENKDLRRIHSDGYLRGSIAGPVGWSIDEILHGKAQPVSTTHLDTPGKELRSWKSQQQLHIRS